MNSSKKYVKFFSNGYYFASYISPLIMNNQKFAEVFNSCFNNIVKELNIPIEQNLSKGVSIFDDPIIAAVHKYKRHPTILKIKEKVKNMTFFLFIMLTPISITMLTPFPTLPPHLSPHISRFAT